MSELEEDLNNTLVGVVKFSYFKQQIVSVTILSVQRHLEKNRNIFYQNEGFYSSFIVFFHLFH